MPARRGCTLGCRRGRAVSTEEDVLRAAVVALPVAARLVQVAADAMTGTATPESTARALIEQGLELVPVETLRRYLDDEAVRRANIAADLASIAKFGAK